MAAARQQRGAPAVTGTHIDNCPAACGGTRVVRAEPSDAPVLTEVIAAAFFEIAPCVWLFPDHAERRRALPRLLRLHLEDALEHGAVYTTEDRCAAAVWFPRSDAHRPRHDEQARLIDAVGAHHAERVRRYDAITEAAHPATPHDYLWAAAVHPERQRSGIGSALLGAHHRLLDERGRAAYLEASDAGTRQVYLTLGYCDMPVPRIALPPPDGCVLYAMWRMPALRCTDRSAWTPSLDGEVRVRAEVPDWGGGTGYVVGVKLATSDRPVLVVLDQDERPQPGSDDPRAFAVAELEPNPTPPVRRAKRTRGDRPA
jgi:GNAT superfamily N-acetyltransferase